MVFQNNANIQNRPIGIFDSGIGGLTVLKEISRILPNESIIYFGDTARVPYGTKSKETVTKFSIQDADFLMDLGVKMIVVACNTASSLSLDVLKRRYDIPLVGVIDPGARKAAEITSRMKVGVIGTKATISSHVYENRIRSLNPGISVVSISCPLFVPLVEEGRFTGSITRQIVKEYLAPIKKSNVDILILGCTHYPLLKAAIRDAAGSGVFLVDSAKETAKEVEKILNKNGAKKILKEKPIYKFYVSDEPFLFKKIGEKFLGRAIDGVKKVEMEAGERYVRDRSIS